MPGGFLEYRVVLALKGAGAAPLENLRVGLGDSPYSAKRVSAKFLLVLNRCAEYEHPSGNLKICGVGLLRSSARAGPALDCELPFGEGRRFAHNELAVRGWARAPAGIAEVTIEIGSTRQAAALSASGETRFESLIDTSTWRPGTATLTVTALDREGRAALQRGEVRIEPYTDPVSGTAAVAGTGTALHCRSVGPTAPHLPIKVRGWAYSRCGVERVAVFLDGRSCHEALYGLTRPHIGEALGAPDALECGYYLLIEPFACEPGVHVLTVVATPREGPPVGVSRSFVCGNDASAAPGEGEPSIPADPSPRPSSVRVGAPRPSPGQVARDEWLARLTAGRAVLDAGRELSAAGSLPFERDSFDLVTCFEGLDRVEDPKRALDELCRVLRPGGLLIVSWRQTGELEPSLRRRFASVRRYRQDEHAASVIVSDGQSTDVELRLGRPSDSPPRAGAVTIAVASDGRLPDVPGLAVVGPDSLNDLRESAAGWKERALLAEADAAARLTERAHAQRGEERALMLLRSAEESRRNAERALESPPARRLRRYLSRAWRRP